jgi:hypothetical protein
MRKFTTSTKPSEIVGSYGQHWREGVLSEHLSVFLKAGGTFRPAQTFEGWAVAEDGRAYPVLCSELVEVQTEDGPMTGRCGEHSVRNGFCEYHDFSDWQEGHTT